MLTEAYRPQGEFLLRQAVPEVTRAEACFHQARAIARHQQAKSWELRAPIYGWFTEGFDTADLQEAQALLEALAR
jgi:predicted ATPase